MLSLQMVPAFGCLSHNPADRQTGFLSLSLSQNTIAHSSITKYSLQAKHTSNTQCSFTTDISELSRVATTHLVSHRKRARKPFTKKLSMLLLHSNEEPIAENKETAGAVRRKFIESYMGLHQACGGDCVKGEHLRSHFPAKKLYCGGIFAILPHPRTVESSQPKNAFMLAGSPHQEKVARTKVLKTDTVQTPTGERN